MDFKLSFRLLLTCALIACIGADKPTDPPTTHSPPVTTTAAPTTSTPATPPTTPPTPPPTTPPPTTTPAPAPPTTPTPPTPTPTPTPTPDPRGNWTVMGVNETCIMVEMIAAVEVTYPLEAANKTNTAMVHVPAAAVSSGKCDNTSQILNLAWGGDKYSMKIEFGKNDTTKLYFVNQITVSLMVDSKTFPNVSSDWLNTKLALESTSDIFKTSLTQSYRCIRERNLPLAFKQNSTSHDAVLVLSKVQLQAFQTKSEAVFATAADCELDTPDIVPIAVGCALAALVFVVLVAYLVGRRRSQAAGYLSM